MNQKLPRRLFRIRTQHTQEVMIYPQEIAAMETILSKFQTQSYVMLLAPMQSGKTATYKLTACEMLRQGLVEHVVIFSGNREKALHLQTANHGSFRRNYRNFLRRTLSVEEAEEQEEKCEIEVFWGPKLKSYVPKPRTLYIWEESHYAQSQGQQVDAFLQKCGIQATGEAPEGCYVLSVSATPFSELSDNHHLAQEKPIVRLVPGEQYLSVKKMMANRQIRNIPKKDLKEKFTQLVQGLRRYALVRASTKKQDAMVQVAQEAGCQVIHYDMEHDTNLDLLDHAPTQPTVIFIKGKCRMGQRINKAHIDFCLESSTNTDTIFQGLLGRCCGYDSFETIKIYIVNLKVDEIQRFIDLFDGNLTVPRKAANITEGVIKVRRAIIPMRLPLDDDPEDCEAREILLREDEIENHNPPEDTAKIMPILRSICHARATLSRDRTPSQKEFAKGWKLHESGEIYTTGLPLIRDAHKSRIPTSEFGSGGGASSTKDEVVVYKGERKTRDGNKLVLYIAMQIEDEHLLEEARVPVTTGKEVFCRAEEDEELTYTTKIKPECRTDAVLLERTLNECMRLSRSDTLDAPTKIKGPITMTQKVFEALTEMKPRFLAKGFQLEEVVMRGRKPANLGTDVRLASISWKIGPEQPERLERLQLSATSSSTWDFSFQ